MPTFAWMDRTILCHKCKRDLFPLKIFALNSDLSQTLSRLSSHSPIQILTFDLILQVLMLTLQNDPPGLDTAADSKDEFKKYSKEFRRMINKCLQKDPEKR